MLLLPEPSAEPLPASAWYARLSSPARLDSWSIEQQPQADDKRVSQAREVGRSELEPERGVGEQWWDVVTVARSPGCVSARRNFVIPMISANVALSVKSCIYDDACRSLCLCSTPAPSAPLSSSSALSTHCSRPAASLRPRRKGYFVLVVVLCRWGSILLSPSFSPFFFSSSLSLLPLLLSFSFLAILVRALESISSGRCRQMT